MPPLVSINGGIDFKTNPYEYRILASKSDLVVGK
jgi:hypothetical protein